MKRKIREKLEETYRKYLATFEGRGEEWDKCVGKTLPSTGSTEIYITMFVAWSIISKRYL